jgi:hypothetical protein
MDTKKVTHPAQLPVSPTVYATLSAFNESMERATAAAEALANIPYLDSEEMDGALEMLRLVRAQVSHNCVIALDHREETNAAFFDALVVAREAEYRK